MGINGLRKGTRRKPVSWFALLNSTFLFLLAAATIFPFYYVIIVSFADYTSISKSALYLFPISISLDAYKYLFKADFIVNSFFISVFVTLTGTLLSMVLSVMLAYPLSKTWLPKRNLLMTFILITLLFNGGLIPYYMTIKAVHLVNKLSVLIVPMAVNALNVILLKNYFQTVPQSLEESAKIDGANDLYILYRIIIPTCTPIIATISLFYAVDRWNEWWHAMLFLSSRKLYPLQMVLREALFNFDQTMSSAMGKSIMSSKKLVYSRSLQMAIVVVATIPILVVYPYLQKYFTKGLMLGSIKE